MQPPLPDGLRHWRRADAPALLRAWSDAAIVGDDRGRTLADAEHWIAGVEARWTECRSIDVVVTDARSAVLGEVGVANIEQTRGRRRAELGIWIADGRRRAGYASAAVDVFCRWLLTHPAHTPPIDSLWARTPDHNEPARNLFRRLGWVHRGHTDGFDVWVAPEGRATLTS